MPLAENVLFLHLPTSLRLPFPMAFWEHLEFHFVPPAHFRHGLQNFGYNVRRSCLNRKRNLPPRTVANALKVCAGDPSCASLYLICQKEKKIEKFAAISLENATALSAERRYFAVLLRGARIWQSKYPLLLLCSELFRYYPRARAGWKCTAPSLRMSVWERSRSASSSSYAIN